MNDFCLKIARSAFPGIFDKICLNKPKITLSGRDSELLTGDPLTHLNSDTTTVSDPYV